MGWEAAADTRRFSLGSGAMLWQLSVRELAHLSLALALLAKGGCYFVGLRIWPCGQPVVAALVVCLNAVMLCSCLVIQNHYP